MRFPHTPRPLRAGGQRKAASITSLNSSLRRRDLTRCGCGRTSALPEAVLFVLRSDDRDEKLGLLGLSTIVNLVGFGFMVGYGFHLGLRL